MTRLWDKGTSLDARVLEYTAGDDHLLDNRLVSYDIRGSIAHAEMLKDQGLLSEQDLAALRGALTAIGEEHAQGRWRIALEQEDCQTAIENLVTARLGAGFIALPWLVVRLDGRLMWVTYDFVRVPSAQGTDRYFTMSLSGEAMF